MSIYLAHRDWDWATKQAPHGGRAALPRGHVGQVRAVLREMSNAMAELLSSPMVGRGRHTATPGGARKLRAVQDRKRVVNARVFLALNRVSAAAEEMKTARAAAVIRVRSAPALPITATPRPPPAPPQFPQAGLPGNEAARIRQYVTSMLTAWEQLRIIKRYRTPLTTRAFSRTMIWAHPFIMARRRRRSARHAPLRRLLRLLWLEALTAFPLLSAPPLSPEQGPYYSYVAGASRAAASSCRSLTAKRVNAPSSGCAARVRGGAGHQRGVRHRPRGHHLFGALRAPQRPLPARGAPKLSAAGSRPAVVLPVDSAVVPHAPPPVLRTPSTTSLRTAFMSSRRGRRRCLRPALACSNPRARRARS